MHGAEDAGGVGSITPALGADRFLPGPRELTVGDVPVAQALSILCVSK